MNVSGNNSSDKVEMVDIIRFFKKSVDVLLDKAGIVFSLLENRIIENPLQKPDIVIKPCNFVTFQSLLHKFNSLGSVRSICDQFGNHRVIKSGYCVMLPNSCFNSNSCIFLRLFEIFKSATSWHEIIERILCVYSHLNCIAFLVDFLLFFGEGHATGDHQLPLHKIITRDHL